MPVNITRDTIGDSELRKIMGLSRLKHRVFETSIIEPVSKVRFSESIVVDWMIEYEGLYRLIYHDELNRKQEEYFSIFKDDDGELCSGQISLDQAQEMAGNAAIKSRRAKNERNRIRRDLKSRIYEP